jgi:HSP20 family protein
MANITPSRTGSAPVARRNGEWDLIERMRNLMQFDPFQDFFRPWLGAEAQVAYEPRFDVREDKDGFVITADMPGMGEGDIDISITGKRLLISGRREEEKEAESKAYFTRERSFGAFSRSFVLPETIDAERIEATLQDGVLELRVPKRPESQPKKIPLHAKNGGSHAGEPPAPREEGM